LHNLDFVLETRLQEFLKVATAEAFTAGKTHRENFLFQAIGETTFLQIWTFDEILRLPQTECTAARIFQKAYLHEMRPVFRVLWAGQILQPLVQRNGCA
jgi:hypothetical protein